MQRSESRPASRHRNTSQVRETSSLMTCDPCKSFQQFKVVRHSTRQVTIPQSNGRAVRSRSGLITRFQISQRLRQINRPASRQELQRLQKVVVILSLAIDAEMSQHGRREIGRRHGVIGNVTAVISR